MKKIVYLICVFVFAVTNIIPAFAGVKEEENNYLIAQRESVRLNSRLADLYTGYEFAIKNIYTKPVKIITIQLWDDASAQVAYLSAKKNSKDAAKRTIAKGASYALPTLTLSFWGGLIVAPFSAACNSLANKNALKEAKKFDKPQIKEFELKAGETYKFKTLALNKRAPSVRIIFVNPLTDENMNLEILR